MIAAPLTRSIPDDVTAIMRRMRVSQTELAKRLGVSGPRVSQMFSTERNWSLETVERVFAALGCELHHFVVMLPKGTSE